LSSSVSNSKMQTLEEQVISLKKDMRRRDDRLQRMTEQNLSLTAQVETQKREIYYIQSTQQEKDSDLGLKEQRFQDAIKAKKRAIARANKMESALDGFETLQKSLQEHRSREKMLMDSIEVLSRQNEELASELNKSLKREIELRSMQLDNAKNHSSLKNSPVKQHGGATHASTEGSRMVRNRGLSVIHDKPDKVDPRDRRTTKRKPKRHGVLPNLDYLK
jgi:hypothetical protein